MTEAPNQELSPLPLVGALVARTLVVALARRDQTVTVTRGIS